MTELPDGWYEVVGRGRMGEAIAEALRAAGIAVRGPQGRGASAVGATVVLLCVPDREIAAAAAAVASGPVVGHLSASAALALLAPHERFTMHPLLSVVGAGARFHGVTAAVEASTPRAHALANALATRLGMRPRPIDAGQRALYHAAASAASNYLVTVEGLAERLGAPVGLDREALAPLVRSTVENWARLGAGAALTGPIARGDLATARRQRDAVAQTLPDALPFWDALVAATASLAAAAATSSETGRPC